jgi:phenylacetate-coenzyme A ligase PaaK-like adenylate-forming protein
MGFEVYKEAERAVSQYRKMTAPERDAVRGERLKDLFFYAKVKSPYFHELYDGIGGDFSLRDLPITNKTELVTHYDDWVTDRRIKLADLLKLTEDTDNIGKLYLDQYTMFCTSGSTGKPGVFIYDEAAWNAFVAVHHEYTFARKRDLLRWALHGRKSVKIFTKDAFNGTSVAMRRMIAQGALNEKRDKFIDLFEPIPEIVKQLNAFQPAAVYAYPTVHVLLAEEARAGRLKISPAFMSSGGEHLSETARKLIQETFGCYLLNTYGCTEGGAIAHECRCSRLHIHDDWIIMEPVDENNNPAPSGTMADKWLMTALASHAQPIIRYEIKDRLVFHDEGCPCGDPSPWIEVEGRVHDVFICAGVDGEVRIAPMMFYDVLAAAPGIKSFQLVQLKDKNFELRMLADDRDEVFERLRVPLNKIIADLGAKSKLFLAQEQPRIDPVSGKIKNFIIEK